MPIERDGAGTQHPNRTPCSPTIEDALALGRSTELALLALAEAAAACARLEPVTLDPEYLGWIARIEALPCNQSGANKTWVHELHDSDLAYFRSVRRVQ